MTETQWQKIEKEYISWWMIQPRELSHREILDWFKERLVGKTVKSYLPKTCVNNIMNMSSYKCNNINICELCKQEWYQTQ